MTAFSSISIPFFIFAAASAAAFGLAAFWLRRARSGGLQWQVWTIAALLLVLTWGLVRKAGNLERERIQTITRDFALLYGSEVERLEHWRLGNDAQPDSPLYLELIAAEKRWLRLSPTVHDIYTFRQQPDGTHILVVDSETDYDRNGKYEGEREQRTAIGEVYEEDVANLGRAFRGENVFVLEPVTDRWGTWLSSYVPLRAPDGRVEAVLGVDFEANILTQAIAAAEWRVIGLMAVAQLLLLGASTLISLTRAEASARQRAEAVLRKSEEKLRLIFEHASQVFYARTVDGRLSYVSPQAQHFFDCSSTEALQPWTDFLTDHPVNAEGLELTRRAIDTGAPQRPYQLELRSKLGRTIWVEVHESPIVIEGRTVTIIGALTDITARKRDDAKLRAKEARYLRQRDALIAFASGAKIGEVLGSTLQHLTETDARTMQVARVSVWLYNSDRSALQCLDLYELAEDRHSAGLELPATAYPGYFRALEALDVIAAEDAPCDPRTCEFSEGYLRPLGITSMLDAPIHLGTAGEGVLCHEHIGPSRRWTADEETFAVAVANRISLALEGAERQRAEEELRSAHAQLDQMVTYSPAMIYRLKVEGESFVPLAVSANITAQLGYTVAETLHREWWPAQVHPEDRLRAFASSAEILRHDSDRYEYRVRHKEGGYRWVEDHRRVLRDATGQPQEVIGVWMDISERKRNEAALAEMHKQLLDASRQAGMAEIATNVLHNVGNVLNSVNISVSVATDKARAFKVGTLERVGALLGGQPDLAAFFASDPRGAELPVFLTRLATRLETDRAAVLGELDALRQHIDHINEIVAMQQNYAKGCGVTEVLPLIDLIEDALRLNAGSIERHGLEVVRDFAEVPPLLVDRHKVLLILVNLIRNAKFALDDGAVAEKRLTLRLSGSDRDHVHITVHDNGVGIPAENLTRIFNHGFTTRADGHGFGLHSSANAAHEMGGSLTAQSAGAGQGATFTLELPLPSTPQTL